MAATVYLGQWPKKAIAIIAALILVQCSSLNIHVPPDEEKALATDGTISRYHALLNTPFTHPLNAHGYIIGIEKSPRAKIGFQGDSADFMRLRAPFAATAQMHPRDLAQQRSSFDAALDDPKVMFVSHILRYGGTNEPANASVQLIHSAYSNTAFGPFRDTDISASYEAGWAALDRMEDLVIKDIRAARAAGRPYTHLLFASMGWNNDQFEAIARYNAVLQHSRRAAQKRGAQFKPLVIGLTWPSVWGGTSVVDLANRAAHIGSYTTKARDADEIGYGIANHILNASLPRIEAQTGLPLVLLGHSMGARILTRAYYSAALLKSPEKRSGPGPTVISLQAAFSANRFLPEYELVPPVRWILSGEGGPYQNHSTPDGRMVMTWSAHDTANPIARFATGARHVGGKAGARRIDAKPELTRIFEQARIADRNGVAKLDGACQSASHSGKVLYLDATGIIAAHGDIANPAVGELVWKLVDCLGP